MIVHCPDCRTRYEINHPPDWAAPVKVRCPRCRAVFPVTPGAAPAPGVETQRGPVPEPEAKPRPDRGVPEARAAGPAPVRNPIVDPQVATRLARAILSELVLLRDPERRDAMKQGTLLSTFGGDLVTAYRLYNGRVSPRLRTSRRIFRDAVNEVVGGGTPLL
jgi:predicted Zn finger-like uncharacterized protein